MQANKNSEATEDAEKDRAEPALAHGVVENVLHAEDVVDGESFVDGPDLLLDGGGERVGVDTRSVPRESGW